MRSGIWSKRRYCCIKVVNKQCFRADNRAEIVCWVGEAILVRRYAKLSLKWMWKNIVFCSKIVIFLDVMLI
jgi:hypothetical protein